MRKLKYIVFILLIIFGIVYLISTIKPVEIGLQCYNYGTNEIVHNVKTGDKIECSLKLPYYGDYKITDLNYKLSYGNDLDLVDKSDSFKRKYLSYTYDNDNNYSINLSYYEGDPLPINYIFEVTNDTNVEDLYIELQNIDLKNGGRKYNVVKNYKYTLTNYRELENENFNFNCKIPDNIKTKDKCSCTISIKENLGYVNSIDYNIDFCPSIELTKINNY